MKNTINFNSSFNSSFAFKKSTLAASATILTTVITLALPIQALAEAEEPAKNDQAAGKSTGTTLHLNPAHSKEKFVPDEYMSDLRDTRLSLGQVKQQAVNLFLEATRPVVPTDSKLIEHSPLAITASMFNPKTKYQPPRKEWLVFYINTLEPIIQLLTEDMKDVEQNGLRLPDDLDKKITPLMKPWHQELVAINKAMDELQDIIGTDDNNAGVTKTALIIFDRAAQMEKLRYQAAQISLTELYGKKSK